MYILTLIMVEIKAKLVKIGGTYAIYIPKALISAKVLDPKKRQIWELKGEVDVNDGWNEISAQGLSSLFISGSDQVCVQA